MKACKRVEIIIDEPLLRRVVDLLTDVNAPGYTIFHNVTGAGDRGRRRGDELTGVFNNCCVLIACDAQMAETIIEGIRPILQRSGGACLVSDAFWIRH